MTAPRDISPEVKTLETPDFMVKELKWPKDGIYDGLVDEVQAAREVMDDESEIILVEDDEDGWSTRDIVFAVVLGVLGLAVASLLGLIGFVMFQAGGGKRPPMERPAVNPGDQEMADMSASKEGTPV